MTLYDRRNARRDTQCECWCPTRTPKTRCQLDAMWVCDVCGVRMCDHCVRGAEGIHRHDHPTSHTTFTLLR